MIIEPQLTTQEASEILKVSRSTLKSWRQKRVGPAYTKIQRGVRYSLSDLEHFLKANREVHPVDPAPNQNPYCS